MGFSQDFLFFFSLMFDIGAIHDVRTISSVAKWAWKLCSIGFFMLLPRSCTETNGTNLTWQIINKVSTSDISYRFPLYFWIYQ